MGACSSADKDPGSAVRFRLAMGTKKVYAPAPAKGGPPGGESLPGGEFDPKSRHMQAGPGFRSPGFGSKDEIFFDSRAWLDSDCEDFFSVKGDFTPSRGSTPDYQTGIPMKPQQSLIFDGFPDTRSEPSPRKKLAELFRETMPEEHENNVVEGKAQVNGIVNEIKTHQLPKPLGGTPCFSQTNSICSGERISSSDFANGKEKGGKAMQCCLPNLVHSLNFNERRKQTPNSGPDTGG